MSQRANRSWQVCLVVASIAACHDPPGAPGQVDIDSGPSAADARPDGPGGGCDLSGTPVDIDLLFVVGNGERGAASQIALFNGLELFFGELECALGAKPNLHVGVISSNLGAGGFDVPRCTGDGDDGVLQFSARIAGCEAPSQPFLTSIDGTNNFEGPIDDAVECVGRLGTDGCTFEQPLAAAIRATDGSNAGFLRPSAVLGIVIASGSDDCSAADPSLFDPALVDPLGPLSAFRCFEQGVECNPDDPRTIGDKTDCVPRTGGLVTPITDLTATLTSRKADPNDVVIGFLGGIPDDVTVAPIDGQLALDSACPSPLDIAPAIRLSAIPNATGALTCLPSPSNLGPLATAIAAAASD